MVNDFKSRNISVIFYRLRRVVFRVIVGVSMHPTLFHNCRTEEEVYQLIRAMNESKIKYSTSMCVGTLKRSQSTGGQFRDELGTRHLWLTQSAGRIDDWH